MIWKIKSFIDKKKWRARNKHNNTCLKMTCPYERIHVGNFTYGTIDAHFSDNTSELHIGHFVSIADNVKFIVSGDHNLNCISTFPFKDVILGMGYEGSSKGNIVVDDDVWIGYGAIILSGVHIGRGAVIAAGAVVNKDVEPYAVVGGVPARVIKYRFEEEIIKDLLKIDFGKLNKDFILKHIEELYSVINTKEDTGFITQS